jgi:hypothetical protein
MPTDVTEAVANHLAHSNELLDVAMAVLVTDEVVVATDEAGNRLR